MPQVMHPPSPTNSTCFQQSAQKLWTSATIIPHPAQRGGSAKSSAQRAHVRRAVPIIRVLSPETAHRTSGAMGELFDMDLRAKRRDRAARTGPELFLFEGVVADCLHPLARVP